MAPDEPGAAPQAIRSGPVDIHVHAVGNGSSGSGCRLEVRGWRRLAVPLMLRQIGLPAEALAGDLDRLYAERLLHMVRESSLRALVLLAHDQVRDDDGRVIEGATPFYVPNEYVLKLAREHEEFLPAVSIHPARPDAMEELERCLSLGAALMKCLPNCHNINCSDKRFTPFWERMAEARLPLLAHTGGEHTLPVLRPEFSDPRVLELPLRCGVTVIAAHSATKSGLLDSEYFHVFAQMTRQFPNLYGDNSAFNVPFRGRHTRACLKPPLADRMLHGSDFPVPVSGLWSWMRGFVNWKTFRRWEKARNPIERDYQLKLAMGFAPQTFTRAWGILRLQKKPG
jgi:uncharacterized protein